MWYKNTFWYFTVLFKIYSQELMNVHDFHCGMVHRCYSEGYIYYFEFQDRKKPKIVWNWVKFQDIFNIFKSDECTLFFFFFFLHVFTDFSSRSTEQQILIDFAREFCEYTLNLKFKKWTGIQSSSVLSFRYLKSDI